MSGLTGPIVRSTPFSLTAGNWQPAIGFPTVPRGKARIRAMLSAAHSREDLDFAVEKFAKVGRELGVIA